MIPFVRQKFDQKLTLVIYAINVQEVPVQAATRKQRRTHSKEKENGCQSKETTSMAVGFEHRLTFYK